MLLSPQAAPAHRWKSSHNELPPHHTAIQGIEAAPCSAVADAEGRWRHVITENSKRLDLSETGAKGGSPGTHHDVQAPATLLRQH